MSQSMPPGWMTLMAQLDTRQYRACNRSATRQTHTRQTPRSLRGPRSVAMPAAVSSALGQTGQSSHDKETERPSTECQHGESDLLPAMKSFPARIVEEIGEFGAE